MINTFENIINFQNTTVNGPEIIGVTLRKNIDKIISEGRGLLKPPRNVSVSEWADENVILSETSFEPGRYRTARAPHSKAIMDAASNGKVRQITMMGSSQVGKTQIMLNIIGYFIDIDPCHIILMQPTEMHAKDFSNQKLDPMIQDTQILKQKVSKNRVKDKDNSTFRKRFAGGYLTIIAGTSPGGTRQKSARVVIGDEIDAIGLTVKEGDPSARLIKRTTTYSDSLAIFGSTPTLTDSSRIYAMYEQSNKMKYYVRCPHCDKEQYLKWENLTWEKDIDLYGKVTRDYVETVKYGCEGCGTLLSEGERVEMLGKGYWKADRPHITHHIGFWINELSSTLSTMQKVAQAIVDAGDDSSKLEALYNTTFGLPYKKTIGKEIDSLELMHRVEDFIDLKNYRIPQGILYLTGACDVQEGTKENPQRLEAEVWGWGKDKERWLVYKTVFIGNLKNNVETWDLLDRLWEKTFIRVDGVPLKISVKFVDSGDETQTVYDYVKGREHENLFAVKGSNRPNATIIPKRFSDVDKGQVRLLSLGTQIIKKEIFSCLEKKKEAGPKYTHFPRIFCDAEYFRQLTAEHEVTKYYGTYSYTVFEKKNKRDANEALDLFVYNYAAQEMKNPNYEALEMDIKSYIEAEEEKAKGDERVDDEKIVRLTVNSKPYRRQGFVNNY